MSRLTETLISARAHLRHPETRTGLTNGSLRISNLVRDFGVELSDTDPSTRTVFFNGKAFGRELHSYVIDHLGRELPQFTYFFEKPKDLDQRRKQRLELRPSGAYLRDTFSDNNGVQILSSTPISHESIVEFLQDLPVSPKTNILEQ